MTTLKFLHTLIYDNVILKRPVFVIVFILAVVSFLGYRAKDFRLDASAETLVLEQDEDLKYSRLINSRYGESDFLVIAYTPEHDLFSREALMRLGQLREELLQLKRVSSVLSILDALLLQSPPVPLKELAGNIRTLDSPDTDLELAKQEISNSPIYRNLLISPDLRTTAVQIVFQDDEVYRNPLARRNDFREKQLSGPLTDAEEAEFDRVREQFKAHRDEMRRIRHQDILEIRSIMDKYQKNGQLFLGGVSMIADDMITFIKNDLRIFGLGVLFFLIITLKLIFQKTRWIVLPMLCCAFSAVSMMGLLGIFGWEVTVISSNFISIQLIITMAITIHLIVRYRELNFLNPDAGHRKNISRAVGLMLKPCLFAALTTIAGFASLVLCNILPVINFGWMMIAGIGVSLIMTFSLFPAGLMILKQKPTPAKQVHGFSITSFFAGFTESHGPLIMLVSGIAFLISVIGILRLEVENSFIDYFKKSTEIYQGMKVVDQKLGGTTPLDVIIDLNGSSTSDLKNVSSHATEETDVFDEFSEFEEEPDEEKYWFTSNKMAGILKVHDYLDGLPETGKVMSLGTMMKMADILNHGEPLDNFELALVFNEVPEDFKTTLIRPYVSIEHDQVRFSIRIRDSEKSLKRNELLQRIRRGLIQDLGFQEDQVHLTGMLVLYNNMLQSLFSSQIMTLGTVVLALMTMFLILFRSFKISLIAIMPNLMSIAVVLGFMGWMGIPLDMMTITIAAISVGIAVDDTIHYIHRFRSEFKKDRNYMNTVYRCHESIGYAMYYTSITIIIGFSILILSNFYPTIYFGLLTGLAMFIALVSALTLLPQLLIFFKPYGPES